MTTKKKKLKPAAKSKKRKVERAAASKAAGEFQWRERRLRDIPFVDRHPTPEARKYNDTLPLPFGGEVKKDAMREHGLFH